MIRVVAGVDIKDSKSERAAYSVWRAKEQSSRAEKFWVVEFTVTNQVSLTESTDWQKINVQQVFRHDDDKLNRQNPRLTTATGGFCR